AERFAIADRTVSLQRRSLDPERRLKVAYLSADLRDHPVARFAISLLRYHDRSAFEVHVFSSSARSDWITDIIRGLDVVFHDVHTLDVAAAAQRVANEGIDIAIDLGGQTSNSLLAALPYRPAPIQASFLGFPATTG